MFSSTEFVEEWNQIFSFKIKEDDLAKPTETFLFSALINYLKMFNFNTVPMIKMKNSENVNERRAFFVRFCNYIDHIYKISDKSHCFLIYDLKHPSPKKTVHMLNHLLNYFFYYNMFKESIIPVASSKIQQRQKLIADIKKYKFDHEILTIRAKDIEKHIKNLRPLAPQTLAHLNKVITTEVSQKDTINYLESQLQEYHNVLESLREEETLLSMDVVSKEEVERLQSNKNSLESAIDEQLNMEQTTFKKNQERSASMVSLQNIMSSIDSSMDLNPPSFLQSHKDCFKKHQELESKFTEISQKKDSFLVINEKLAEDFKKLENDCTSKNTLLAKMKITGEKEIEDIKMLAESKESSICDLNHDLQHTEKQLENEKNVTEYILETTALLVRATKYNTSGN